MLLFHLVVVNGIGKNISSHLLVMQVMLVLVLNQLRVSMLIVVIIGEFVVTVVNQIIMGHKQTYQDLVGQLVIL